MKFTYANVMSTIAMFAAVTTGTSYAAVTLAKDSVRTTQIKNGQVTLADLHPTVRAKLSKGTTGGGGTTTTPTTGLLPVGEWADTKALTGATWPEAGGTEGRISLTERIGTTGNVEFRVTGNLTKPEGIGAQATIYFRNAASVEVAGWGFGLGWQQAGTFTADQLEYQPTNSIGDPANPKQFIIAAKNAQSIYSIYGGTGATSTLRLQVRRVA